MHVPRKSKARRNVRPLCEHGCRSRNSRIAGEEQTRRGAFVYSGGLAFQERVEIEVQRIAILENLREVGFPAEAGVQRHVLRRCPRVLREQTDVPLMIVEDTRRPVLQAAYLTGEKVGGVSIEKWERKLIHDRDPVFNWPMPKRAA